jgi:hypothetical protein
MTQISITTNAPLVRQGLENLAAEIPQVGRRRIYNTSNRVLVRMRKYPKERIGQRYRRTGRLGAGWKLKKLDTGYTVINDTKYTKYVVGNAYGLQQAWMHVSTDQGKRWQLLRDEVEAEIKTLPQDIEDEIKLVARRNKL